MDGLLLVQRVEPIKLHALTHDVRMLAEPDFANIGMDIGVTLNFRWVVPKAIRNIPPEIGPFEVVEAFEKGAIVNAPTATHQRDGISLAVPRMNFVNE